MPVLLQVGVISGFNRELPFFLGKDDQQEAYYLAATAKWLIIACVLLTLVATAGTLGVLAWFSGYYHQVVDWGIGYWHLSGLKVLPILPASHLPGQPIF